MGAGLGARIQPCRTRGAGSGSRARDHEADHAPSVLAPIRSGAPRTSHLPDPQDGGQRSSHGGRRLRRSARHRTVELLPKSQPDRRGGPSRARPLTPDQSMSNRSRFITFSQAATKSRTNFSSASSDA